MEGSRQRIPEIVGVTMAFVAILVILLGIVYDVRRRSYSIKSQRNSLDVSFRIFRNKVDIHS